MANEVRILITAVNQTQNALKGITGSFTELNSALNLLEKGLGYVDKAYDATVGTFIKYSEQVEDLSRVTGMSADETSRLIQTADDLFVSYDSLKLAARTLAQQGLTPNIETMAQLSDKYRSFTDENARAEWAVKTFGRNYAEMTKILEAGGTALRQAAEDQPTGLILNEQDLENAKAYKQSIDQLNDAFQALEIEIGKKVVPALIDVLEVLNKIAAGNEGEKLTQQWEDKALLFKRTGKSLAEYNNEVIRANKEAGTYYNQLGTLTQSQWEAIDAVDSATLSYQGWAQAVQDGTFDIAAYTTEMDRTATTADLYYYQMLQVNAVQDNFNATIRDTGLSASDATKKIGADLTEAYKSLQAAQQEWNTTVGEDAASSLKEMGLSAQQTQQGLAAIDSVFNTNTLAREQYNEKMTAINEEFAKTGDVDAYKESLGLLAAEFETRLAKGIEAAQTQVDILQKALDVLAQKEINVPVHVTVDYPNGGIPTGAGGATTTPGTTGGTTGTSGAPSEANPGSHGNPFAGPPQGDTFIFNTNSEGAATAAATVVKSRINSRITTRMGG